VEEEAVEIVHPEGLVEEVDEDLVCRRQMN